MKIRGPRNSIHTLGSLIRIRYLNHSEPSLDHNSDLSEETQAISVVMCTYNGERFVRTQLETILGQTLPPTEIVISDDGSTDRTLDIVAAVAERAPIPIRIHRNEERLGFSENFLRACTYARSRFIALSDQDDEWAPDKLATARAALLTGNAELCVHAVQKIDANGCAIEDKQLRWTRTRTLGPLQSNPFGNFYGFTMLFDRRLLDLIPADARGRDPHTRDARLSHDRWIYFLAATFGRTVILRERLAGYRQHDGQLYGGLKARSLEERISTKLIEGQIQSGYLATVAGDRATLLDSPPVVGDDGQWAAGARYWRSIESHLANRARLYDDRLAHSERVWLLIGNLQRGTYRSFRNGGLSSRRLAEDAVITALKVLRAPRQRERPTRSTPLTTPAAQR